MKRLAGIGLACLVLAGDGRAQVQDSATTKSTSGIDVRRIELIEPLIHADIKDKKLPGAVVLVGRSDRIAYQKAFGNRALVPAPEPMTADTIFDLASLTKVVATTTSVLMLIEDGKVRLTDRVATFIPGFERYGKGDITIRHLITHVSGLRPDVDLGDLWTGYDKAIELAIEETPTSAPGERFVYSDINFFLLGDIVKRVSGKPLDEFTRDRIFKPLGMKDTGFNPPASVHARVAPTENCTPYGWPCEGPDRKILRGVVHDPTARRMMGVAGHAGLFSTAADLSIFCRMLLNGGSLNGVRVLSPLTVERMLSPTQAGRGLGWDMDSSFAANRGELFPLGSFGHTGWTGTSLWIDPATKLFVVFLSNRNHPDGKGDVTPLRARVSTVVASALTALPAGFERAATFSTRDYGASGTLPQPKPVAVMNGIDALRADGFGILRGKKVGLVTNHTGRARDGATTIDLLHGAKDVTLVALFSPEHGIRGILDSKVASEKDEKTGLVIHSLYGETRRPTDEMLKGIDTMVIDLQDVGARFYTYITTMAYVMEESAKRNIAVVVLDRVNPINGVQIEGPALDKAQVSFVGYFAPMPVRHGMTLGELAKLFNAENKIGANLTVVQLRNWQRDHWFDATGIPWINPSPNMRNLIQATLYPGIGAIEGTNVSVGRGTDTPFEQAGAPWIDGVKLAEMLNAKNLSGIRFYPIRFTPTSSKYANQECQGVFMVVTDRAALRPVRVGAEIAGALVRLHGAQYEIEAAERLFGSKENLARLRAGDDPSTLVGGWSTAESRWRLLRAKYLIYR
jgi:uncharacterized protein YbbC (DUF1343 family)/CubicO group peptidase (beta-lactamase class C family)